MAALATLLSLTVAAPSMASVRLFAAANSADTTGPCTAQAPCRLDRAVSLAQAGDEVVVEPGTYAITYPVVASGAFTIVAQAGQPRPALIGDRALTTDTLVLSGGASVRGLYVESNEADGRGGAALSIDGATAENMILNASATDATGSALREQNSAGTLASDTVARSAAAGGSAVQFGDGGAPATATAVNITAVGEASGVVAFRAKMLNGHATVKNSIALGGPGAMDLSAPPPSYSIDISYSNFRRVRPSDYWDRGGNQTALPVFVDSAAHAYEESGASPTIDAGQPDPVNASQTDPDGNPRVTGLQTDMGAYQYSLAGAPGTPTSGGGAAVATGPGQGSGAGRGAPGGPSHGPGGHPVLGRSVVVSPQRGVILVRRPGASAFAKLQGASAVPVGSEIDTTRGEVRLTDAVDVHGRQQVASFAGGLFRVRQPARGRGLTQILLLGGSFNGCRQVRSSHTATLSRARRPQVVRQLWGHDHGGRFETWGRSSIATVRGTIWLTQDRCDGTVTQVLAGSVTVHERRRHRTVLVRAGQRHFARA